MTAPPDHALLADYARTGSEAAFAQLVARHIHLVHSAARRYTGNEAQAEEITQAVFLILARKAGGLSKSVALSGWLYQTARLTAANALKAEQRRQSREQEAYMESKFYEADPARPGAATADVWREIAPLLDEAMGKLGATDRTVLVLRFFEGRTNAETAAALGLAEGAVQRRGLRALEKLRANFARQGVTHTAQAIAGTVTQNAVMFAPAGLLLKVSVIAAKGAATTTAITTLVKGTLKIMAWTKAQTAIVAGVGVLLAVGTTSITLHKVEAHRTYSWEVPKADFGVFYKAAPQVCIVPTKFSVTNGGWVCDSSRGAMGIAQPVGEIVRAAYQEDETRTVITAEMPPGKYDFLAKLVPPQDPRKSVPTDEAWAKELQDLIRKQFGIIGRYENRETDVLVLKLNNPSIQGFKPANSLRKIMKVGKGAAIRPAPGQFAAFNQPMDTLNSFLERRLNIPIVDRTEMTNNYDFVIKWDEADPKQPDNDALKKALANQLGLELVPSREPIEMLVVEEVK